MGSGRDSGKSAIAIAVEEGLKRGSQEKSGWELEM